MLRFFLLRLILHKTNPKKKTPPGRPPSVSFLSCRLFEPMSSAVTSNSSLYQTSLSLLSSPHPSTHHLSHLPPSSPMRTYLKPENDFTIQPVKPSAFRGAPTHLSPNQTNKEQSRMPPAERAHSSFLCCCRVLFTPLIPAKKKTRKTGLNGFERR